MKEKDRFFKSFVDMAARGLYSFDNLTPGITRSFNYYLIAYPRTALQKSNIPTEIEQRLFQLPIKMGEDFSLDFIKLGLRCGE